MESKYRDLFTAALLHMAEAEWGMDSQEWQSLEAQAERYGGHLPTDPDERRALLDRYPWSRILTDLQMDGSAKGQQWKQRIVNSLHAVAVASRGMAREEKKLLDEACRLWRVNPMTGGQGEEETS